MTVKYWTVDEARRYLPRLKELVGVIRHAERVQRGATGSHNGQRSALAEAQDAFQELEEGDIILRDASTGLVDFHARGPDDVVYFLCWRMDEDDLGWWHLPEEGFAGRRPLPRDPA